MRRFWEQKSKVNPHDEPIELGRVPNRAERRRAVEVFKAQLALLPKQRPVRNPTIIPKVKRRRR